MKVLRLVWLWRASGLKLLTSWDYWCATRPALMTREVVCFFLLVALTSLQRLGIGWLTGESEDADAVGESGSHDRSALVLGIENPQSVKRAQGGSDQARALRSPICLFRRPLVPPHRCPAPGSRAWRAGDSRRVRWVSHPPSPSSTGGDTHCDPASA